MQLIAWVRGHRARRKLRDIREMLKDHHFTHVFVAVQSKRDSALEILTHISAGLGYQLVCEFLVAPMLLASVYEFKQAMVNIAIYVPVRYWIGYVLRRRFVDIIRRRWTPIPGNKRELMSILMERDDRVFNANLERDEAVAAAARYRQQLVDLVGGDMVD